MALTLVTGTGSATTGPSLVTLQPDPGEWGLDTSANGQTTYFCSSAAQTFPAQIRFATQKVTDVFGSSLPDADPVDGQTKVGRSLLFSLRETWGVYNGDTLVARYPIQGNVTVKYPLDAVITAAAMNNFMLRLLGVPFRGASETFATPLAMLLAGVTRIDIAAS